MKATVETVSIIPGDYSLTQGHKGGRKTYYKNGRKIKTNGHGWGISSEPTRIIINCIIGDDSIGIYVDNAFREKGWTKLTMKRVVAIKETCPNQVEVRESETYSKELKYFVSDKSLDSWFEKAKDYAHQ